MDQLDDLREQLTNDQRALLDAIWGYYNENGRWVPRPVLHHRFLDLGKSAIRAALVRLGCSVVFESRDDGKECYRSTFLGVFLTSNGHETERLLVQYLEYVRGQYLANPEIDTVRSQDIERELGLTSQQSDTLRQVIQLGQLWSGSASWGFQRWSAGIPPDVDELPALQNLSAYVRGRAVKDYDPTIPFDEAERTSYLLNKTQQKELNVEFWFISAPKLQEQLASDWLEAQAVHKAKAWKSCVILCGSILEGLLLDILSQYPRETEEIYTKLRQKSPPELSRWSLADMVEVARERGVLREGVFHLSQALREFRNLIHPGRQMREKVQLSEEEASIAVNTVRIYLRELEPEVGPMSRVPLPSEVRIIRPAAAPPQLTEFLGRWHGVWDDTLNHILVVEEISEREGSVIYAWGDSPLWRIVRGFTRVMGTFEGNTLVIKLPRPATVVYQLRSDGKLDARYDWQGGYARAILTKADER